MNLHFDVTLISCQTQFHMHKLEDDSECTVAVVWGRSHRPTASRFRRRQNWTLSFLWIGIQPSSVSPLPFSIHVNNVTSHHRNISILYLTQNLF